MIAVGVEAPTEEAIGALLRESDAVAAALYPGEYRRPIGPAALTGPGIVVIVARQDGVPAGMCVVYLGADGAELKRMVVAAAHRRKGIGAALLRAAEGATRSRGAPVLRMEVGVRNTGSAALYRVAGYRLRGPFGAYRASPISTFLEKPLGPATPPPSASVPRAPRPAPG